MQWFREAAYEDATDVQRIFEESTLSALYLMTLGRWLFDDSPETANTRKFLDRSLRKWDGLGRACDEFLNGTLFNGWQAVRGAKPESEVVATEFRRTDSKPAS